MIEQLNHAGFVYIIEHLRGGVLLSREVVKNLMPTQGLNYLISAAITGGTAAIGSWFIGLFEGNYTPVAGDTAATIPGNSTETTAYDETTRQPFTPGTVAGGIVSNGAARAEFTMNAARTLYGGFMTSSSGKGTTTGVLLSAARFPSPKVMESGDVLRISAGFIITSAP